MIKLPKKYQGGGATQVYRVDNQQYQPVNYNMPFQAFSMPIDVGLDDYINLEQLQVQRGQFDLQTKELDWRIKTKTKDDLKADLKALSTVTDDFLKLKILPSDAAAYEAAKNKYLTPELLKRAQSGDTNAIDQVMINAAVMKTDPDIIRAVSNKIANDDAIDMISKMKKDQLDFVSNYGEIMSALVEGRVAPKPIFDQAGYDKRQAEIRLQEDTERASKARLTEYQAKKLEEEIAFNEKTRLIRERSLEATARKAEIGVINDENEIKAYDELIKTGKTHKEAMRESGLLDDDKGYSSDAAKIADMMSKGDPNKFYEVYKDILSTGKESTVTHSGSGATIDKTTGEVKSISVNGKIFNEDTAKGDDGKPVQGVSYRVKDGKAYIVVEHVNDGKGRDWLKKHFGWEWDAGFDKNTKDFVNSGKVRGAFNEGNALWIPADEGTSPVMKETSVKRTVGPQKVPLAKSDI